MLDYISVGKQKPNLDQASRILATGLTPKILL